MKDLIVRFSEEHASKGKEELSPLLDSEVEDFSRYMSTIGDWRVAGPLAPSERALIKTYLVQKLTGKIDGGR